MNPTVLKNKQIQKRFFELSEFLQTHQNLWQTRPFHQLPLSWEKHYPHISKWLRNFSEPEIEKYAECLEEYPNLPQPFYDWVHRGKSLSELASFPYNKISLPSSYFRGVPGKKQRQIRALCQVLDPLVSKDISSVVDWCSGKGHMGRTWFRLQKTPTTFIEKNEQLCQQGNQFLKKEGISARFLHRDVLRDNLSAELPPQALFLALHACGNLHNQLLKKIFSYQARAFALSPCCYHRIDTEFYRPLSCAGKKISLKLDQNALCLAMLQENPERPQELKFRRQSMKWRLAFDLIVQEKLGKEKHVSLPSFPRDLLRQPFSEFCQKMIEKNQLSFSLSDSSCEKYLSLGQEKLRIIRGLGLLLNIFRRPLELWLVLDKAMYLQEKEAVCQVGKFCSFADSPRNILLFAEFS